jgi:hypothetical protein
MISVRSRRILSVYCGHLDMSQCNKRRANFGAGIRLCAWIGVADHECAMASALAKDV